MNKPSNDFNVYINTQFTGHYPVGTAAVVVAGDRFQAADMLNTELAMRGLKPDVKSVDMVKVNTERLSAHILCDGNY